MKAPDDPRGERSERETKSAPGEDTNFMEEILMELSAQNEHARSERAARVSTPPRIEPAAKGTSHPPVIHVKRDDSFRTAEGMPRARAYLPVRTLPPNRATPVETATVHVADPRRMPTMRVARPAGESASGPESAPASTTGSSPPKSHSKRRASSPPLDDLAPTLRSAPGVRPEEARPSNLRFWVGGVAVAAIAGAIAVTLARAWVGGAGAPAASGAPVKSLPATSISPR